jgi:hypothetical protein
MVACKLVVVVVMVVVKSVVYLQKIGGLEAGG